MITTVEVQKNGKTGFVSFNDKLEGRERVTVAFPDSITNDKILAYLTSRRTYRIPKSNELDDFEEIIAYPYDNITFFELAMCTLFAKTEVLVNWNSERVTEAA